MGIDRTDFLNGMQGVLETFADDAHTRDYWEGLLSANAEKMRKWYNVEDHLYSWLLGREQAYLSVLATFPLD